jgi:hypothetical protein
MARFQNSDQRFHLHEKMLLAERQNIHNQTTGYRQTEAFQKKDTQRNIPFFFNISFLALSIFDFLCISHTLTLF